MSSLSGCHPLTQVRSAQYERFGKFDEAAGVWSKLVKKKSRSAAAWYGKADFET